MADDQGSRDLRSGRDSGDAALRGGTGSLAGSLHSPRRVDPEFVIAIDTERVYLGGDISAQPPVLAEGRFAVPEGPGLGVDVDQAMVDRYAVSGISVILDAALKDWFPTKPAY